MSDKLPEGAAFFDLSDYGRRPALWLARVLVPTPVTPIHLTWAFLVVGLSAAALYAIGGWVNYLTAGLLLIVKSILDAADGSLARARNRPSRVGRYLDSDFDFLVNLVLFLVLGFKLGIGPFGVALALVSLLFATLQGSWLNHLFVAYRHQLQGDLTSLPDEREAAPYPWDSPRALKVVRGFYLLIYGWQDRLMSALDRLTIRNPDCRERAFRDRRMLSLTTVFGLGFFLLLIAILGWIGHPEWALYWFIGPANLVWIGLLIWRRAVYHG